MRGTGIAPASVVKWAALLALMSILLFACGQKPEPPEEPEEEPVIVVEEPEPEPEPEPVYPYVFPLTGIGTEEKIEHRPIVVFVENSPRARPQSGLDQADIVFELLAEGDITRFVAVFQSEAPEEIGPVRSARPYLVEIGYGLDGLIVHAGWSQEAKNMLVQNSIQHFDAVYGDHDFFWRSSERVAPHNLYTSTEKIWEGVEARKYRADEWKNPSITFIDEKVAAGDTGTSDGTGISGGTSTAGVTSTSGGSSTGVSNRNLTGLSSGGGAGTSSGNRSGTSSVSSTGTSAGSSFSATANKADRVDIPYIGGYYVSYEWNAEEARYIRSMMGEEHVDKISGDVLVGHNILVLKSDHRIVDDVGRRHVDVVGPGSGYLLQMGTYQEVTWQKVDGLIRVFDEKDQELPWIPGKTWIHIIPHSSEIHVE